MNMIWLQISSLVYLSILFFVYISKERVKSLENKIFKAIMVSNIVGLVIELGCFMTVINMDKIPVINSIVTKLLLVYYLTYILLFTAYVFVISYRKDGKLKEKQIKYYKNVAIFCLLYFILNTIFIIVLPMEYYNNNGIVYSYGASVNYMFFVYAFLIILWIGCMCVNFKNLRHKKYLPLFAFIILGTVVGIVQKINPALLLMTACDTVVTFLLYFTIENPDLKLIRELEYAKNTAEKANRAKSDFLSSMSHEIRTPLNAIVGLSECIKNSDDIEEIHEDANDVVMASNNLLEIVNGILDISKIEADKMEIIETNYNPVELFDEVATIAKTRIGEKEIDLRCHFAEDIPDNLYGDKGKLKQIITNVLSNAVKYTEQGHIKFNVSCINEIDKCNLQIIISDTGRGIKPDQIDTIFNKFERAEEDKNSTIEGTGLGLAITKSLVEMMGGKILVHSTYGEGSKFTIFLEQKYSKTEDDVKVVKNEKVSYSNKKVLVVDDNKLNIKVASKVLSEFELNIDSADSGFSAIEKIENNEHYDIIFMDIMMPKMSGVETLKKLKEIDGFNTPVVALTADAMEGKSTKYIEVGFNEYLSKPINKDELKRVLNKCLNGNIEIKEENTPEEDPHIHRVIPITDEDIEMLNKKMAEDLAKQKEQEEKEKNNN